MSTAPRPDPGGPSPGQPGQAETPSAPIRSAAASDDSAADAFSKFDSMFAASSRPRDCFTGALYGLRSTAMGLAQGAVSFVAMPVLGYREAGVVGLGKGLATGVASAAVLTVAGVGVGVVQVVRGVANTPESVSNRWAGKAWSEQASGWVEVPPVVYSLAEDLEECAAQESAAQADGSAADRRRRARLSGDGDRGRVADTALYDLLGVSPDASQSQIKKAFYVQSRKVHPDRNTDVAAVAQFQALSEAYQVLANERRRAEYDTKGLDDATAPRAVDPTVFCAALFSADKFAPFVGELALGDWAEAVMDGDFSALSFGMFSEKKAPAPAAAAAAGDGDGGTAPPPPPPAAASAARIKQRRRELNCALHVIEVLAPFERAAKMGSPVLGSASSDADADAEAETENETAAAAPDPADFAAAMEAKALSYVDGVFGARMLVAIGFAYQNRAAQYLGDKLSPLGVEGHLARLRQRARGLATGATALGHTAQSLLAAKRLADVQAVAEKEGADGEQKAGEGDPAAAAKPKPKPKPKTPPAAAADGSDEAADNNGEEAEVTELGTKFDASLPLFLETAWSISAHDIEVTSRRVAAKLLNDHSVSSDERDRRARGLRCLGQTFLRVGRAAAAAEAAAAAAGGTDHKALLTETLKSASILSQGQSDAS